MALAFFIVLLICLIFYLFIYLYINILTYLLPQTRMQALWRQGFLSDLPTAVYQMPGTVNGVWHIFRKMFLEWLLKSESSRFEGRITSDSLGIYNRNTVSAPSLSLLCNWLIGIWFSPYYNPSFWKAVC